MNKYNICLKDFVYYEGIEASSKVEAIGIAMEMWDERIPKFEIEEYSDEDG